MDYINLMAYDYSSDANFSPVAPFYWIEANLDALFDANIPVEKILLGLNWYGYQYSLDGEHQKSILGREYVFYLYFKLKNQFKIFLFFLKFINYFPDRIILTYV